jgi:hypothetical protein
VKLKKSEKNYKSNTQKHYYMKCAAAQELVDLVANDRTSPKLRDKIQKELVRREGIK